jgi:hypothetical protein
MHLYTESPQKWNPKKKMSFIEIIVVNLYSYVESFGLVPKAVGGDLKILAG